MTWPVILRVSATAYPLGVVQRAAYALANSLTIQVVPSVDQIDLMISPPISDGIMPADRARALVIQSLNDFALRDRINRESAGIRELLAHAALSGCGLK